MRDNQAATAAFELDRLKQRDRLLAVASGVDSRAVDWVVPLVLGALIPLSAFFAAGSPRQGILSVTVVVTLLYIYFSLTAQMNRRLQALMSLLEMQGVLERPAQQSTGK